VLPGGGWLLPDRQRFVVLTGDQWLDKQQLMEAFREALLDSQAATCVHGACRFPREQRQRCACKGVLPCGLRATRIRDLMGRNLMILSQVRASDYA